MAYVKDFDSAVSVLTDLYNKAVTDARSKGDTNFPQAKRLLPYNTPRPEAFKAWNSVDDYFATSSSWSRWLPQTVEQWQRRANDLLTQLDRFMVEIDKIRDQNILIIQHNQTVAARIEEVMRAFGIPLTYSEMYFPSSRSRVPKRRELPAGYKGDIQRNIIVTDKEYDAITKTVGDRRKRINDAVKTQVEIAKAQAQAVLEAEEAIKRERLLATMRVKYDTDPTADANDLLEVLLDRDKYLRLGHYLLKNRIDWNDGPHFAKIGLYGFVCDDEPDAEIYDEISSLISNWCGDGRCFRDTTWNYDAIFDLAPKDLFTDYTAVKTICDDFD